MSVQRLQPADDGSGDLVLIGSVWEDSNGLAYVDAIALPGGALPNIDAASASAANHATLDGLDTDITSALGGDAQTAAQIVAGLEARIDRDLGVVS